MKWNEKKKKINYIIRICLKGKRERERASNNKVMMELKWIFHVCQQIVRAGADRLTLPFSHFLHRLLLRLISVGWKSGNLFACKCVRVCACGVVQNNWMNRARSGESESSNKASQSLSLWSIFTNDFLCKHSIPWHASYRIPQQK